METVAAYRFQSCRLLPAERRLLVDDTPARIGSRALETLLLLVEERDRTVTKAELLERVWPRLVVEENNLQVQVAALRKLLGPAAITTVPGQGYRFTLPVETEAAHAAARANSGAPDVAGAAAKGNAPLRLAPLYGRDADLAAIVPLVGRHPLVSVVGAGGIGKTRVAVALAHRLAPEYRGGAWIVDLAALTDPRLVAAEVARTLGVPQLTGVAGVAAELARESLLLVLDNCEHVLDPVAELCVALLEQAPGVHVLVTSQEPLRVPGEQVYRLDPLAVPDATADADADADAQACGAVQLFVERAKAADPHFALSASTLPAVAEICRRLDGIPLAIELAAARVALLGVEGVRARLGERFGVLTGGSRLVLRRHQTLRAALDFSHGLLSEAERTVFRRLGVFGGSFAPERAQHVCASDSLGEWEVLECLGTLVDKSLVMATGSEVRRLRLLETTRAYALEKLADAGETTTLLRCHAESTAALMRGAYDDLWRRPHDWVARYEPELDNLRAAIDWSCTHAPQLAIELVGDSLKLWQELALQPEALRHCERALALLTDATPPRAAGRLWYAEAMMCANTWLTRSRDAARTAVALLRDAGDEAVLACALARLAGWSGNPPEQEQWDAIAELAALQRPGWTGQLRWLHPLAHANVLRCAGRFAEARGEFERARDLAVACCDDQTQMRMEVNIAEVARLAGDLDGSVALFRELAAGSGHRDQLFHAFSLIGLANGLLMQGDSAGAREALARALPLVLRYDIAFRCADTVALLALAEGNSAIGIQLLGFADSTRERRGGAVYEPTETQARERAVALAARVPKAQRDAWLREGAQARDSDLLRAALPEAFVVAR